MTQVRAEAAETKRALSSAEVKVEERRQRIVKLGEKEKARTREVVQRGDIARRWKGGGFAGAFMPHGLLLASLKYDD